MLFFFFYYYFIFMTTLVYLALAYLNGFSAYAAKM